MEKLIFEKGKENRSTPYLPKSSFTFEGLSRFIPQNLLRKELKLPCLGELDVVRHYSNLAKLNFSVDNNFYPLGSCTMKYNPKINEAIAAKHKLAGLHPYQKFEHASGALALIYELEKILIELTGMAKFSFQASSGAQGEFIGMLMIKKYHQLKGNKKTKVIVPDSAHGTNPATSAMCGYETIVLQSNAYGLIDLAKLESLVDDQTAAIMLTNPNTLGLFEEDILKIADLIHKKDGLLYYDGANFNALMGVVRPSDMGFDLLHLNLHKTFATPHGCGGPGAGAVGVNQKLVDFLPIPVIEKIDNQFKFNYLVKHSIGRVRSFYGNFTVLVRAYVYLLMLGKTGVKRVAENAVLNANYIRQALKDIYQLASVKPVMHEVVFSCMLQKQKGVSALDIAKRMIDYNLHPPTMYFPLVVKEALMVEPTETESKETLDNFIAVMKAIAAEVDADSSVFSRAPQHSPVRRPDEVRAARQPDLRFRYE